MSQYTITVYDLEKNNFDFGLDHYEIFDEYYRPILNNAILSYYRFREIGFQNPALWREILNLQLDMIMRNKYNALYKAKQKDFNPLYNIDITEKLERNVKGAVSQSDKSNSKSTSNGEDVTENTTETNANNLTLSSQFPSEEMTEDDLSNNLFVDNANKASGTETAKDNTKNKSKNTAESETTGNSSSDSSQDESYTKTTIGSSAGLPFSKAMLQFKEYCDKFMLDQLVIDDLSDLFMSIW